MDARAGLRDRSNSSAAFVHRPALTAAEALRHLERAERRPPNRELLEKGRLACELIKSELLNA